jgi:hypothetical protein
MNEMSQTWRDQQSIHLDNIENEVLPFHEHLRDLICPNSIYHHFRDGCSG